jgi:hypothetical protein
MDGLWSDMASSKSLELSVIILINIGFSKIVI